ncbi:MAG: reverse transcriptase domain-containing protein [Cetobacterium sp.]
MKRYGYLFDKIIDIENIKLAHKNASKGKSKYKEVKMVNSNLDFYCNEIKSMLESGRYKLNESDYKHEIINDKGKQRDLYKLKYYPHRIIQWAIINVVGDIFDRKLISQTYASIKDRGIHKAKRDVENIVFGNDRLYSLKLDVKKYYNNIDNKILYTMLENTFKDRLLLNLLREIVFSRGDKGQPIGSLLSQYLGNFYLNKLDHYCKEKLKLKYFRYCDDIVVLSENKSDLWKAFAEIRYILNNDLNLKIKENWQIFKVDDRSLDFVGYRFFSDKTIVRKSIYKKARVSFAKNLKSKSSYYGWFKHSNNKKFINKYEVM